MKWEKSLDISEELKPKIAPNGDLRQAYLGAIGFQESFFDALKRGRGYSEDLFLTWAERLAGSLWGTFECIQPSINRIDTALDVGKNGQRVKIRIVMWELKGNDSPLKLAALEAMFDPAGEIETFASERDVTVNM